MSFVLLWIALLTGISSLCLAQGRNTLPEGGQSVLPAEALLTTPVGGLERTGATADIVPVSGQPFDRALRVVVRREAAESNATQWTMNIAEPVKKGDTLLASFFVRGKSADGKGPAQMMLLFERNVSPWTKSITQDVSAAKDAGKWKRALVPFTAAESYRAGEAMVSLRFAFGPQTVEVGGLTVLNYGTKRKVEELVALAAEQTPLGVVTVAVRRDRTRQTLLGLGGNFCQPRYGHNVPLDPVGRYNLEHLRVVHARIGIPLNDWTPERGVYREEGPAKAALQQMQVMAKRKIPIIGSAWEGPGWMLPGEREAVGRILPKARYADCIEAVAQFLVTARDKYGARVDYFSFNEPDYGVNFKFTPEEMAAFIRQAGPRFRQLKLKTKFLVGDTANATNFAAYARPLLEDRSIQAYLGPLAFHSWDALGAPDARYAEIAEMGRKYGKSVWCTEGGHDAALWQQPNPWESWENGLRTALAYEKTLRLSGAEVIHYWTYQDNYPLVSRDGTRPFAVFQVMQQMEEALPPGAKVAETVSSDETLKALATVGPKPGEFSVLLINPVGAGRVTLSGLPPGAVVSAIESTAASQRKKVVPVQKVDRSGKLTIALPPRSVLTLHGSR